MKMPSDTTIETWVKLLRAQQKALSTVESALKKEKLPPLIWYDILLELERVGQEGLRPFELEKALLLPQYGVSRIIDRIEKSGYLKRENCEDDKRGQRLFITENGQEIRKKMWPIYGAAIENAVGSKISPTQQQSLSKLLSHLMESG